MEALRSVYPVCALDGLWREEFYAAIVFVNVEPPARPDGERQRPVVNRTISN